VGIANHNEPFRNRLYRSVFGYRGPLNLLGYSSPNFDYDAFVSHAPKDSATARDLAERLQADGLRVWLDEWEIHPGESILARLDEGLERSRVLVLCMSRNVSGPQRARQEAETLRFRETRDGERRLVPLLLDDGPISERLRQYRYIDWRQNRDVSYQTLLAACGGGRRAAGSDAAAVGELALSSALDRAVPEGTASSGTNDTRGGSPGVLSRWEHVYEREGQSAENALATENVRYRLADAELPIGLEQLTSVHELLDEHRQATEQDIVITTVLEGLFGGPLSEPQLADFASRVWPGAGIDRVRVGYALTMARRLGYVVESGRGPGDIAWAMTEHAYSEVRAARDWASQIIDVTAAQVRDQLADAGRETSQDEAFLWTMVLQRALLAGARGRLAPYVGRVTNEHGGAFTAAPNDYDWRAVESVIRDSAGSPSEEELMRGLVMTALNPAKSFAEDLVTSINVGYVLQGFVGRRDHASARSLVGTLRGDWAILDTPILVPLLGSVRQGQPIERLISAARGADMEVIVPEYYLEELQLSIAEAERHLPQLQHALDAGLQADDLAQILKDDILSIWLDGKADGRYSDWRGLLEAAANLGDRLSALGVNVRGNNNKPADRAPEFEHALLGELADRRAGRRIRFVVERDASTMEMVRRHRERARHGHHYWPGAWVITSDRHLGPAYRRVCPNDPFGLTLKPASLLVLLSNLGPPARAEELARSASRLLNEEAFMAVAARFPVSMAVELAHTLQPNGGSDLGTRVGQTSINDLLDHQPDFDDVDDPAAARVVAEVVRLRAERLNSTFAQRSARLLIQQELAMATQTQSRAHDRAQDERVLRLRQQLRESRQKQARLAEASILRMRRRIVGGLALAIALAAAWAMLLAMWVPALLSWIAEVLLVQLSWPWMTDRKASWKPIVFAVATALVSISTLLLRL
jgi:hypothetical protein